MLNLVGPLRPSRLVACALLCSSAAVCAPHALAAGRPLASVFRINPNDPESSVPTAADSMKAPLEMGYFLIDVTEMGDAALARRDYAAAVKFFRAMAKAVPDRSVAYAKQCAAYEGLGEHANAVEACRTALGLGGVTPVDYAHFVTVALAGQGKLKQREIEDIDAIVAHLQQEAKGDKDILTMASQLQCELGARLNDGKRLETCTRALSTLTPNAPENFVFRWALAMQRGDQTEAERIIAQAKAAKVAEVVLTRMTSGMQVVQAGQRAQRMAALKAQLYAFANPRNATIVAALVLAALGWFVSRRRARPTA